MEAKKEGKEELEEEEVSKRVAKLLKQGNKMLSEHCPKCGSPLFLIKERGLKYCPKCEVYLASRAEIKKADIGDEARIYDFDEYWKEEEGRKRPTTGKTKYESKKPTKKQTKTYEQKKVQRKGIEGRPIDREMDATIHSILRRFNSKIKERDVPAEKLIEWLDKMVSIRETLKREQFES